MPIDAEVRKALHDIRDQLALKFTQVDLNTEEIKVLKSQMAEHLVSCAEQKVVMEDVKKLMIKISDSQRLANLAKQAFLWVAPIVASGIVIYKAAIGVI